MKTTIDIPAPLFKKAKQYALRHHTTLKVLVESGLQYILLHHMVHSAGTFKLRKSSVSGSGLQPGLDWTDWGMIRKMAYEGRGDVLQ